MATTVLPRMSCASVSWMAASTSESSALGRLVQQQNGGVLQHDACQSDALALAAGELHAALPDQGIVAGMPARVGQGIDELIRPCATRGCAHLGLDGLRAPVEDVFAHRSVQERSVLRHHADLFAHALLRGERNVLAVDEDAARSSA